MVPPPGARRSWTRVFRVSFCSVRARFPSSYDACLSSGHLHLSRSLLSIVVFGAAEIQDKVPKSRRIAAGRARFGQGAGPEWGPSCREEGRKSPWGFRVRPLGPLVLASADRRDSSSLLSGRDSIWSGNLMDSRLFSLTRPTQTLPLTSGKAHTHFSGKARSISPGQGEGWRLGWLGPRSQLDGTAVNKQGNPGRSQLGNQ